MLGKRKIAFLLVKYVVSRLRGFTRLIKWANIQVNPYNSICMTRYDTNPTRKPELLPYSINLIWQYPLALIIIIINKGQMDTSFDVTVPISFEAVQEVDQLKTYNKH